MLQVADVHHTPELLPEQHLIAAVIRQAVRDARSRGEHGPPARQWLRDAAVVLEWLDLAGFPEGLYRALLVKAHIEEESL